MLLRWYPDFDFDKFYSDGQSNYDEYHLAFNAVNTLSYFMYDAFINGVFRITDGNLTYKDEVYNPQSCFGDLIEKSAPYFDLENSQVCFIKKEEKNLPLLSDIADSEKNLGNGSDLNTHCDIALIIKGTDGRDYAVGFPDGGMWDFYVIDSSCRSIILFPAD